MCFGMPGADLKKRWPPCWLKWGNIFRVSIRKIKYSVGLGLSYPRILDFSQNWYSYKFPKRCLEERHQFELEWYGKVISVQHILIHLSEWWINNGLKKENKGHRSFCLCDLFVQMVFSPFFSWLLPPCRNWHDKNLELLGVILNWYFVPHIQVYIFFSNINYFHIWSI